MVPIQWYTVKGFLKYTIEMITLMNFLNVITKVTVRDEYSTVKL